MLINTTYELHDLNKLAIDLCEHLKSCPILLLKGNLGSGKTTLCKLLLKNLGVSLEVSSPTFNIVNTYSNSADEHFYHFDLYRIKQIEELEEFGFFEYLDSGSICLIEWPEIAESSIDLPHLQLSIEQDGSGRLYQLIKIDH